MREPEPHQLSRATEAARTSVRHADAPELLRRYYDPTNGYAGSTFLNLEPNDPRDLTATDLYALSLLDVRATPLAGRRLLQPGDHRERVLTALASPDLPASANLLTATPATFDAAETLYLAVRDALGQKPWVTASKLCAEAPALLPRPRQRRHPAGPRPWPVLPRRLEGLPAPAERPGAHGRARRRHRSGI
jgi:hypothetical protein